MKPKHITPLRAIRFKCLDCCCGSAYEVKLCACEDCSLYPFRMGRNPVRDKKELSPEQLERKRASMAHARNSLINYQGEN